MRYVSVLVLAGVTKAEFCWLSSENLH